MLDDAGAKSGPVDGTDFYTIIDEHFLLKPLMSITAWKVEAKTATGHGSGFRDV